LTRRQALLHLAAALLATSVRLTLGSLSQY